MALDRMRFLQFGLHATTTDFSGAPTFTSLDVQSDPPGPPDTERIERDTYRADNQDFPSIIGLKMLDEIPIDLLVRGLSGNIGAAMDHTTTSEIGLPLDAAIGTTGTDPAGAATTTVSDAGATPTVTVVSDANCANGGGVMWQRSDGSYVAREQVSKAANVLTVDRKFTAAAIGADTVLYRSCVWRPDPVVSMHKHVGIRSIGELDAFERTWLGCGIQNWTLSGGEGKPTMLSLKFKPTDWSDTTVNPAYVAPVAGDFVIALNSRLFIADESFMFKSWEINGGYTVVPRTTDSGPNGVNGYIVRRKSPTFKGRSYFGTNGATFGEINDSAGNISLNKIQGLTDSAGAALRPGKSASTYDCAIQIGAAPGSCIYARMPACELAGKLVNDNGVEMIDWNGKARRAASGLPLRLHVF